VRGDLRSNNMEEMRCEQRCGYFDDRGRSARLVVVRQTGFTNPTHRCGG